MVKLKNGYITDGTSFIDRDDVVHIEQETEDTFLISTNDGSFQETVQMFGDSTDLQNAVAMVNEVR